MGGIECRMNPCTKCMLSWMSASIYSLFTCSRIAVGASDSCTSLMHHFRHGEQKIAQFRTHDWAKRVGIREYSNSSLLDQIERCLQHVLPEYFSTFQNLRLGAVLCSLHCNRDSMCDRVMMRSMWETTSARNSHAGFGTDFTTKDHTSEYVKFVKWLTKSGVAISRRCCFPPGMRWSCKILEWWLQTDPHTSYVCLCAIGWWCDDVKSLEWWLQTEPHTSYVCLCAIGWWCDDVVTSWSND